MLASDWLKRESFELAIESVPPYAGHAVIMGNYVTGGKTLLPSALALVLGSTLRCIRIRTYRSIGGRGHAVCRMECALGSMVPTGHCLKVYKSLQPNEHRTTLNHREALQATVRRRYMAARFNHSGRAVCSRIIGTEL